MKKHLSVVLGILLSASKLISQEPSCPPLHIGDSFFEVSMRMLGDHGIRSCKLSNLPRQPIIVDLWATWCTGCLYQFPALDSLQRKFKRRMSIILLDNAPQTGDSLIKAKVFVRRYLQLHPACSLSFAWTNTALLKCQFPIMFIPHYVWLNAHRVIVAITNSEAITPANLALFVKGHTMHLPVKNDHYH